MVGEKYSIKLFGIGSIGALAYFLLYMFIKSRTLANVNYSAGIVPAVIISIVVGGIASTLPGLKARGDTGGNVLFYVLIIIIAIVMIFSTVSLGINLST